MMANKRKTDKSKRNSRKISQDKVLRELRREGSIGILAGRRNFYEQSGVGASRHPMETPANRNYGNATGDHFP